MKNLITCLTVCVLSGAAFADTINVPGDYPTIQAAVGAASDGDEIIVAPGIYVLPQGQLSITKSIQLRSSDGSEKTFITTLGDGSYGGRMYFGGGGADDSSVEGFTFTSFPSQSMPLRFESMSGFAVRNCHFTLHSGGNNFCLGTNWANDGIIENCVFENNLTDGILFDTSENILVENCIIRGNHGGWGGIKSQVTSNPVLVNTIVCGNTPGQINGAWTDGGGNTIANECPVEPVTWTVDDDGKADFDNIQAAIDAASDGDEIIVMPGTYTSTQDGHVVNMLGKAVTLRSSDPSDPDVVATTIIDGENTRRGLACFTGETSETIISGFTITNGFSVEFDYNGDGDVNWWEENYGGGMLNYENTQIPNSSPSTTLTNCTFTGNTANKDGGGMANYNSSPTLTNCTFTGNTAVEEGGGMGNHTWSNPILTDCTFTANTAEDDGGGMYNINDSNSTLTNCTFTDNTATYRGGGMYNHESGPTLIGCIFTANIAGSGGGGMSNDWTYLSLTNCTFTGNTAPNGGGMANVGFKFWFPTLTDTTVCGNITQYQIYGKWIDNGGNTIADECPFVDTDGDGVPDDIDNCYLYNPDQADCNGNGIGDVCDVADSTSFDCDQNGVPDECQPDCDGDGWIDACDNDPDVDGDGIPDNCEVDCNGNTLPDHWEIEMGWVEDCNGNLIPDECDFVDGTVEDCNGNNIPDECDLEDPANDQNNNGLLDECECVGDADLDGYVNVNDLLFVIGYWGNNTPQADLNFDGIVDVTDLLIVVGNWGPCE